MTRLMVNRPAFIALLLVLIMILQLFICVGAVGDEHQEESGATRAAKPFGSGSYSTDHITFAMERKDYPSLPTRVYYPSFSAGEVDPSGAPYPAIVFAPGASGTEISYRNELSQIASWGYIVAIPGTGGGCNQEVVDTQSAVLDFLIKENQEIGGQFFNTIDTESFGASGHSNGGWASIAGCVADDRFKAVSPLCAAASPWYDAGQANTGNLNVPFQLISGASDTTYLPSSDAYYGLAKPITTYMRLNGSGHAGPFHFEYLISFFRVWLDNDKEYSTFVYGEDIYQDEADEILEFDYKLGLAASPQSSKDTVYEDEEFTLSGQGVITSPTGPTRYITDYEWDFDSDGEYDWNGTSSDSIKYSIPKSGLYEIMFRVTDSWGMMAAQSVVISVDNQKPISVPGAAQSAVEDEEVFFDASGSSDTISDMDTLKFRWDFGDYNVTTWDTNSTASNTYTQEANYTVVLFVQDNDQAVVTAVTKVTVSNVKPTAALQVNKMELSIGESFRLNATGSMDTESDLPGLIYAWDFGDSKSASEPFVEHSYPDEGVYEVILTVTDDDGDSDTARVKVTVLNSIPTCVAMDDIEIFEDELVQFSGSGSDTDNDKSLLQYSWYLGVPMVPATPWSDTAAFEFTYTNSGSYTAVLTVRDDNSATASDTVEIFVKNVNPEAKFLMSSRRVEEDEIITFDATASIDTPSDISNLEYTWHFGDGSAPANGAVVEHIYYDSDDYEVELTVTDDDGISDVYTKTIEVTDPEPNARISASTLNTFTNTDIQFSAFESTDTPSDQVNLTYSWDFGDGGIAVGDSVVYSFADPGRFKVKLTVEDDGGQTDTIDLEVIVKDYPAVNSVKESEPPGLSDAQVAAIALNIVIIIVLVVLFIIYLRSKNEDSKEP